ncbi:MAG: hypothetical protein ACFFBW_16435, partial [Promethearchaeota archaeon]
CGVESIATDDTFKNIIAYQWVVENQHLLIVVNYSLQTSKAHIKVKGLNYGITKWKFLDVLNKKEYIYEGKDLDEYGLYVELEAWKGHIFEIQKL